MTKKTKLLIILGIIIVIGIICIAVFLENRSSKKRISEDVIKFMEDSIAMDNDIITKEYLDKNISKVTKESATKMVTLYEEYQENSIDKLYSEFKTALLKYDGSYDLENLSNPDNIDDQDLKNILNELYDNGYKLKRLWGDIIVVKDYTQYEDYEKYVTEDKTIYLNIQNEYDKQLYSFKDIDTLLNSILETEKSIKSIKDEQIKKDSADVYVDLLNLIIEGDEIYVPNIYGEEERKERDSRIQNCINQNTNTVTANILNKYLIALKADNYEYTENSQALKEEISNNIYTYFN